MKKSIIFRDEIRVEPVRQLVTDLEAALQVSSDIKLYFSSIGGGCAVAEILDQFLSENKDSITLIAFGNLMSAGFQIFFNFPGKKNLVFDTLGMVHAASNPLESRELLDPYSEDRANKEIADQISNTLYHRYKSFLTAKERKRFLEGYPIYLQTPRLKTIFKLP